MDVLLIAYDNGDGRAFRSLLPELDTKGTHWHLVAFGPATALFENTPNTTLLNEGASPEEVKEWIGNRYATLADTKLASVTKRFAPRIVLSGMAHTIQAQLVQQWWQQGAWTIAFYDNMEPPAGQQWIKPWFDFNPPVEQVMVTTRPLKISFPEKMARSGKVTQVVHPGLKEWQEAFEREDQQLLKEALELDERPVVLVDGGYGDDYQNSLEVIKAAAALRDDLQWVFTPHPRTLFSTRSAPDNAPLITITDISTVRVATLARAVVTHRSSIGWFASQMGTPVIFVRPKDQPEVLEQGLVRMVNDETTLLNALYRQLDAPAQHTELVSKAKGSAIADVLERHLKEQKPSSLKVESVNDQEL
ncbi:hypothetical protein [Sansalvadorimonas verongulae]|uniref:hypothetical protein n=1 Tax=Sansalvadorimonas verongulae TaxID=2172824 RepID=UPI0012BD21E9|nr:hypothetical protein [Sansalvadorimonas verongulae]MTI13168.1 hypothetical protein [Sansalvadorimonas verongulae]